ncbi:DNA-binding response regulator [Paenibacillus sp. KS1]|uniref:response regulator transcription factor n=1 Tax=Paenibacillus sp. KS1 TaxID=1849249 RepID=UPI0008066064|nr:response regulator [Paenibacillus sp. KS1]OBY77577.1 DNA-binding response regulator [Paenibacillus sp. KS1]
MRRMLIVDDLPIIVDGLLELFQGMEHLELDILKAYSGEEALDMMRRSASPIDIVISDIKMPGLEGIELLRNIKQSWPNCKVIFLTGYNDFQYVQSAMVLGGFDYILKIESDEKIVAAVERAIAQLNKECEQMRRLEQAHYRMRQALPLLQREYVWELLEGKAEMLRGIERHFQEYDIPLRADLPVMMVVGKVDAWKNSFSSLDKSLLLYGVQNIVEEYVTPYMECFSCPFEHSKLVWLLQPRMTQDGNHSYSYSSYESNEDVMSESEVWKSSQARLNGVMGMIQQTCQRLLQVTVSFALSSTSTEWANVAERFQMLKYCFVSGERLPNEVILTDSDIMQMQECGDGTDTQDYFQHNRIQLLLKCLENNHRKEFYELFLRITKDWNNEEESSYARKMALYHSLSALFLSHLGENPKLKQEVGAKMDISFLYQKKESFTWLDMKKYFWELADHLFERQEGREEQVPGELIKRVHRYIANNLTRDISLIAIANEVGLNPSYLSRLYKQMTGIGISDYINDYRNLQAKEWLLNTSKRVNEIASALGYNSALAFIRFFKKQNQMTPLEYRMKLQEKNVREGMS